MNEHGMDWNGTQSDFFHFAISCDKRSLFRQLPCTLESSGLRPDRKHLQTLKLLSTDSAALSGSTERVFLLSLSLKNFRPAFTTFTELWDSWLAQTDIRRHPTSPMFFLALILAPHQRVGCDINTVKVAASGHLWSRGITVSCLDQSVQYNIVTY